VAPEALHIEELRLRVPGVSSELAVDLAREVAERIAREIDGAGGTAAMVDRLELRVRLPEDRGGGGMAAAIAAAILRGLA